MSLLWTRAMAWHDDDRSTDPEEVEADRDTRPYHQRRPELVKHIALVHDVPEHAAGKALGVVERHLSSPGAIFANPRDYGFNGHVDSEHLDNDHPGLMTNLRNHRAWRGMEPEKVPAHKIVATQSWVRPSGIAHNLFHKGEKQPIYDTVEGDPDYDPNWDSDAHGEDEHWREKDAPGSTMLGKHARFFHDTAKDRYYLLDGHHRIGTDMLLGKSHVEGVVHRGFGR